MEQIYIGRQPIFTSSLKVFAYELLFRNNQVNQASFFNGDLATTQVIMNTFMEIGLENLAGEHKAFINLSHNFLNGSLPIPFRPKQVVLEVLEDVPPEADVIATLKQLRQQGYQLALDDFVYAQRLEPLIELADIIKVDVLQIDKDQLAQHVRKIQRSGVKLLAEKVENQQEFERCKALGFDYYQGYFFAKPNIIQGQRIPPNKLLILKLLARLQDADVSFEELSQLVEKEPTLSYKIIKYINSPVVGLPRQVASIHRALLLIGLDALKRWVSLIIICELNEKPAAVLQTALTRAKACELMATSLGADNKDEFFTVGLFSALDAMMDMQLMDLLKPLHLPSKPQQALLQHQGIEGEVLSCVLAYEQADWDAVRCQNLPIAAIRENFLQAIRWADQSLQELNI